MAASATFALNAELCVRRARLAIVTPDLRHSRRLQAEAPLIDLSEFGQPALTTQTQQWLERRQAEMLPAPYFHIIITVPAALREVLRANQRDGYALLMQASAAAIIELARDPRYVGGTVGVLAVLHTWTQQLIFHPHVHCLVSGGGVSGDGSTWHPARRTFLLPIKALAKLVRGKLRALQASPKIDPPQTLAAPPLGQPSAEPAPSDEPRICPRCHRGG